MTREQVQAWLDAYVEAWRSNDAGARAFYQRLCFEAVGRRPGFYPGGIDAISMTRAVKSGG